MSCRLKQDKCLMNNLLLEKSKIAGISMIKTKANHLVKNVFFYFFINNSLKYLIIKEKGSGITTLYILANQIRPIVEYLAFISTSLF
jgi:hypothetical protein